MGFEFLDVMFRGICVGVAASITVGPVAVLCIQRTLSKSRRSGIVSGLGVACADTFMAMAALFFYSMLQTQIEQYNTLLRVIGGIFVVIVGVYIFAQNPVPQIRRNRAGKTSLWQDFASIFGLTIANFIMVIPYILAFFAVFKISGGDISHEGVGGFIRAAFTIAGFFGGAAAWWTMLAFVINLFRRRFRPRHMLTINHVAGLIIGILGIYTILSTFLDIFPNVGYQTQNHNRRRRILVVRKEHVRQSHRPASGLHFHRHGRHVPRRDALCARTRSDPFGHRR